MQQVKFLVCAIFLITFFANGGMGTFSSNGPAPRPAAAPATPPVAAMQTEPGKPQPLYSPAPSRPPAQRPTAFETRARNDELAWIHSDDPQLAEARRMGQRTLDGFLAVYADKPPGSRAFSVKIPVRDGDKVEWFWVKNFTYRGDVFTGQIDNTPRFVENVRQGQVVSFRRQDIADWMYATEGRIHGNFSACVMLAKETAEERAAFMSKFGLTCGRG